MKKLENLSAFEKQKAYLSGITGGNITQSYHRTCDEELVDEIDDLVPEPPESPVFDT